MLAILFTSWFLAPIAPLNPLEQDTLAPINFHLSAGLSGPNGIVSAGPEVSAKYEMLVLHPYVIRGVAEYKFGEMISKLYPQGRLHAITFGIEGLYYRGTKELLGYLGGGPVFTVHQFDASVMTSDSLRTAEQVTDITVGNKFGYRLILGLRYMIRFSFEVRITELYPTFTKSIARSAHVSTQRTFPTKTGSIAMSFGYILPIH